MDFTKAKKGLGDLYADDMTKRLLQIQPEAFLESELAGPDAPLKREIEEISKALFQSLETLSNFHYTPSAPKTDVQIQSQNVPALMLEEAVPMNVSKGNVKSAHEVFAVNPLALREKSELTKEEKRKERAKRKRQIKASLKAKTTFKKEKMREEGLALAEKFAVRETKRQMEKMKGKKKGKHGEEEKTSRRVGSSATVFKNLQKIVEQDYKKRDDKKAARESGKKG